jgi:hypothetical protein
MVQSHKIHFIANMLIHVNEEYTRGEYGENKKHEIVIFFDKNLDKIDFYSHDDHDDITYNLCQYDFGIVRYHSSKKIEPKNSIMNDEALLRIFFTEGNFFYLCFGEFLSCLNILGLRIMNNDGSKNRCINKIFDDFCNMDNNSCKMITEHTEGEQTEYENFCSLYNHYAKKCKYSR